MWIKRNNKNTKAFNHPQLSKPIEFSENGKANVPENDANYAIKNDIAESVKKEEEKNTTKGSED